METSPSTKKKKSKQKLAADTVPCEMTKSPDVNQLKEICQEFIASSQTTLESIPESKYPCPLLLLSHFVETTGIDDLEYLEKYEEVFDELVNEDNGAEFIQIFYREWIKSPKKGKLCSILCTLYDNEIIANSTFENWRDNADPCNHPFKKLDEIKPFFDILEEDSDEDSEGSEASENLDNDDAESFNSQDSHDSDIDEIYGIIKN